MTENLWYSPVRERLVLRRQQIGLTQADVARIAGIDAPTVCHLETGYAKKGGNRQPSPRLVARWSSALRVDTTLVLTMNAAEWPEPFIVYLTDRRHF